MYKMGDISRKTGLRPETIRGWERRFGFLRPERSEGRHRLYGAEDLQLLSYIVAEQQTGRSIGSLARLGRDELLRLSAAAAGAPSPETESVSVPAHTPLDLLLEQRRRTLVEGAVKIDAGQVEQVLDQVFSEAAPKIVLSQVVEPALIRVGELWAEGICSVSGEHLLTGVVRRRVMRLLDWAPQNPHGGNIVVACLPGEQHELGALIFAWRLQCLGWRTIWLGSSLPIDDLLETIRRRQPHAVALSVALVETLRGAMDDLGRLRAGTPADCTLVIGGGGTRGSVDALEALGYVAGPDWQDRLKPPR